MKKYIKYIVAPLGFLVFATALVLLHNQLKNINYGDIVNAFSSISAGKMVLALLFAFSYYLILGGYDILAFKYIKTKSLIETKDVLLTCFISNALGNNTGYSMLFGGSIRYRLYSFYNISIADVTKVLFFSSATIWLGILAIGGIIFTISPVDLTGELNNHFSMRSIGILCLFVLLAYIALSSLHKKQIKIFNKNFYFPSYSIAMWQIFLAIADWILASLTLYVLIPSGEIQYFVLLKVFLVAQFLAIISQVPGGMGVFETTIALLIPSTASNPAVIAGLLVYRAVFYFFPLFTALILLGIFEIVRFVKKAKSATKVFNQTFSSIVVQILALCAFFAGVFSTFSTAVPLESAELKFIVKLPIWIADWAHFLLSVSAITLLFISRGLQQRIKNAFTISCFLISFSIMLMLIVGGHFLLFTWFIFLFIVLLFSKKYFYRKISIFNASLNIWWISSICGVFFLSALIGFFINKQDIFYWLHIKTFFFNIFEYSNTARFLRTNFGVGIIIIIVCLEQVLKNFLRKPTCFRNEDIRSIVSSSNYAYSVKSFLDDKEFVISDKKDAFIMYSQSKNCWIALGDPIGEPKSKPELLWKFKELAEKKSAILAFIGIAHKYLDIYSDLGFNSFLIGKEAKINLKVFGEHVVPSLASLGKHIESKGFLFRQLSSSEFKKYEVIFDNIDTEWQKNLGYVPVNFIPSKYDKFYAKNFNFAVVEKDSAIIAFAILENTANKYEACSSIIRYVKCDYDIFSYLILKIILNAKESGFKFFDLGPAHFSIDNTEEDIMLKQFSKTFMFAEHLGYDSGRLRKFKEQFNPLWSNKYLAAPPGKYMLRFIKNFVSLIFEQKTVMRKHFFRNIFKRNLSEK